MVIIIETELVLYVESVTDAVMVCVPIERDEVVNGPPLPREPARSEVQIIDVVRSPSSKSVAVPEKVTNVPSPKISPSEGDVIEITGIAPHEPVLMILSPVPPSIVSVPLPELMQSSPSPP